MDEQNVQTPRVKIVITTCRDCGSAWCLNKILAYLDFPTVDWVFQMDCPEDWKTYNHRVGRTARNKSSGSALLLLTPREKDAMLKQLRIHKFAVENIE